MFQQELRDMISLCVNILTAVVVITSLVFSLNLKNRVGTATSEQYTAQKTMEMHYEFNAYDGKTITADECIAAYSMYINSDVKLSVITLKNQSAKEKIYDPEEETFDNAPLVASDINSVITRSVDDYRKYPEKFTTEQIRLGAKVTNGTGYTFNQLKKYRVYLAYDDEDEKYAMNKYVSGTEKTRPSRVSAIVFVEYE
jgi:hypothetical protein